MRSFLWFENVHKPALFVKDHRPVNGTCQFNADMILFASKQFSRYGELSAISKSDIPVQRFSRSQTSIVHKTDSILRKVDHRVFQISFFQVVCTFDDENRTDKFRIYNAISSAPVRPKNWCLLGLWSSATGSQLPNHLNGENGDQKSADPENR